MYEECKEVMCVIEKKLRCTFFTGLVVNVLRERLWKPWALNGDGSEIQRYSERVKTFS